MDPTDMGPIYEEIGRLIADDLRADPEGAFLYAEVEDGIVSCSIFKDVGDRVIYRSCSQALVFKIHDAWQLLEPHKRWAAFSYSISNEKFSAAFQFPEEMKPDEDYADRRPHVLNDRFGDKPVDYSDP